MFFLIDVLDTDPIIVLYLFLYSKYNLMFHKLREPIFFRSDPGENFGSDLLVIYIP